MLKALRYTLPALFLYLALAAASSKSDNDGSVVPLTQCQSHETLAIVAGGRGAARTVAWKTIIGKRATVQGIAWEDSKGIGDRVILDGTTLYVDAGARFVQNQGRLVQVTGVFAKRTMPASPPESQWFVKAFEYYVLEDAAVESIESVSSPHVVVAE